MNTGMQAIFGVMNLAVLPFWLAMIVAPHWRGTQRLMAGPWGVIAPIAAYLGLVIPRLPEILPAVARPELPAVAALLGTPAGATIAWAHFLAFDLFVGRWIYLQARERGISAWVLSPILLLTLLLGPLGLLAYGLVLAYRQAPAGGLNRPMVVLALASTGLLLAGAGLMLFDHRQVMGASTWLKPAKFAISVALMATTVAVLLRQLPPLGRRGGQMVGLAAALLALELVIITTQAARGVPSHFNASTPVNATLFATMGAAIAVVTALLAYLGWRSFRQPLASFQTPALGWGVRMGFVLLVAGASLGGLMPGPTAEQRRAMQAGEGPALVGAHAVGVPDGGPGLPITRWSTEGGDLRIPHFVGMHGLQLLPLLGWWLGRRRSAQTAPGARIAGQRVVVAGLGYLGLIGVTLVQALRGQPLLAPDGVTLATLVTVLGTTAGAWWLLARSPAADYSRERSLGSAT